MTALEGFSTHIRSADEQPHFAEARGGTRRRRLTPKAEALALQGRVQKRSGVARRIQDEPSSSAAAELGIADLTADHIDQVLVHLPSDDKIAFLGVMMTSPPGALHNSTPSAVLARIIEQGRDVMHGLLAPGRNASPHGKVRAFATGIENVVQGRLFSLAVHHASFKQKTELLACSKLDSFEAFELKEQVFRKTLTRGQRAEALSQLVDSFAMPHFSPATKTAMLAHFKEYFRSHTPWLEANFRELVQKLPHFPKNDDSHENVARFIVKEIEQAATPDIGIAAFLQRFTAAEIPAPLRAHLAQDLAHMAYHAPLESAVRNELLTRFVENLPHLGHAEGLRADATLFVLDELKNLPVHSSAFHALLEQFAHSHVSVEHAEALEETLLRAVTGPEATPRLRAKTLDRFVQQDRAILPRGRFGQALKSARLTSLVLENLRTIIIDPHVPNKERLNLLCAGYVRHVAEFGPQVEQVYYDRQHLFTYGDGLRALIGDETLKPAQRLQAAFRMVRMTYPRPHGSGLQLHRSENEYTHTVQGMRIALDAYAEALHSEESVGDMPNAAKTRAVVAAYVDGDDAAVHILLS